MKPSQFITNLKTKKKWIASFLRFYVYVCKLCITSFNRH